MEEKNLKIEMTGNPFVDTGLAVISALAKLDDVAKLTLTDLKAVYEDGVGLTEWNSKLKTFTQIFGTNNPLFQPSYGFKKGKGPSDLNKRIYRSTIEGFLSEIGKSVDGPKCWACGTPSKFDFAEVCKNAVENNGQKAPEDKWIGRDWFPLAGSLGSDAQALPAASQPPQICPKCLFAIHYLPVGLMLLDGRLAVFQSTSVDFWYELVRNIVSEVKGRIQTGNYDTLGGKEGSRAVTKRLLKLFEHLQKSEHYGLVTKNTALYLWRFSNSGASPECQIEEIPNPAIMFLWDMSKEGLLSEIESLINSEGSNPQYSLFRCILNGHDYPNLYPNGKRKGASLKLFALYQMRIRNHSVKVLHIAHKLAGEIAGQVSANELKRLQRPEAFKEERVRNLFRASMIKMAERGELALEDYLDLFPVMGDSGITVEWDGWNLIRFYLHRTSEDFVKVEGEYPSIPKPQQLFYYAGQIYNRYLEEKGKDRFQKEVLGQMDRRIDARWLRDQFVQLAELKEGFTYGHWSRLCKLENERLFISELLFQMRLLWIQWVHENRTSVATSKFSDEESTDELPKRIKDLIEMIFTDYVERRGLDRLHSDILLRLRQGKIKLNWFKEKMIRPLFADVKPLTEEEWTEFLVDNEGQVFEGERLFQLHLALANLYRVNNI